MKRISLKNIIFILCISLFTSFSYGQAELKLKKGVVIDSLLVPDTEGVYSIYLPKAFDLNKSWPILFGFDSKGNMNTLTSLFQKAAEDFGYIVVVSNYGNKLSESDKSSYIPVFVKHIISLFPIQEKRMYALGVGDDAPLNTSLPLFYKQFSGVIAIDNSFDYHQKLRRNKNFAYFGIVSTHNFRYQDFLISNKYLDRKGISSSLYTYEGDIALPSQKIIHKALPFFTLDAMEKGNIPKDSLWIKMRYEKDKENILELKEKREYLEAFDELTRMQKRFQAFVAIDELKNEQKEIKKIKAYKTEKRIKSRNKNKEVYLRESLVFALEEDIALNEYNNLGWWQYKMEEFDMISNSKEPYTTAMVVRIRGFLKNIVANYKKELSKSKKEIDRKIFLNVLSTIIDKDDFDSYKNIIALSAIDQDTETALFYLEKMLQQGYKEMDALYTIEGTLSLRISKEYNNIIKKYLGTSKFFTSN
ncbi:hypothetical protein [Aquimarina litoralis]|uniref:hypothetical protein n=1 Tax=Aquimarina litoralis TaxID=584605 RepID=UPI001C57B4B7|nr:hypothetical protein [Aquimarina litoralis]MBW1295621.1 hypothetical protein [Aquimarina litoralis]